jgi:predicted Fe-Mo cluster-binding NifX family protein
MMKLVAACTTSINGKSYIDRHFGDAQTYAIYHIFQERFEYIKSLPNTSEEECIHA